MSVATTGAERSGPHSVPQDGSPLRALVVDDEGAIRELLSMALGHDGWEVRTVGNGADAVRTARNFRPDAVILDVMLPDMDGFEVLRRLRAEAPLLPVVFVTARDGVADRVATVTAGATDYVSKPFSVEEVAARLRRLLGSTSRAVAEDGLLTVGDLTLDENRQEVTRGGAEIHLTATEFEVLRYLMLHPKRVRSKAQILDRVRQDDGGGQGDLVELTLSSLRRKVDDGRRPMIRTVRGVGYVLGPADG